MAEVERAGELQYKINSLNPTCADAGDTGLDCYEPEFFYPRSEWLTKEYRAELTITQEVANDSFGVLSTIFVTFTQRCLEKLKFSPMIT